MSPKKSGILAAVIPLMIVTCLSLLIVGGVVTWAAVREGSSPGELVSGLLGGRQSARPVVWATGESGPNEAASPPTFTPQPSPTLTSMETNPTEEAQPPVETEATATPSDSSSPDTSSPAQSALPSPTPVPAPQIETALESPIRPGSPLPERPATRLVIPAMGLDIPVIISPIENQTWKVDHLGKDYVGHLEGTASPGDPSNVVLAGHVTIAHNVYGPFAGLGQLQPGDPIIVYAGDQPYTYIVDYRQLVDRTDVHVAFPTDTPRITLITCSNWSDELGTYQERLIVVGHLAGGGS